MNTQAFEVPGELIAGRSCLITGGDRPAGAKARDESPDGLFVGPEPVEHWRVRTWFEDCGGDRELVDIEGENGRV